jgi:hypothetical protein
MLTDGTTSTARPAAALNLAEIADRYTSLLYGIGRRYRLTPEERKTPPNPHGLPSARTWTTSATRTASPDGWRPPCAGAAPTHFGSDTASFPPPTR